MPNGLAAGGVAPPAVARKMREAVMSTSETSRLRPLLGTRGGSTQQTVFADVDDQAGFDLEPQLQRKCNRFGIPIEKTVMLEPASSSTIRTLSVPTAAASVPTRGSGRSSRSRKVRSLGSFARSESHSFICEGAQ